MAGDSAKILLCDCEGSVRTDPAAMCAACPGGDPSQGAVHGSLCRLEVDTLAQALTDGPVIVACAQESARFGEVADDLGVDTLVGTVDLREIGRAHV